MKHILQIIILKVCLILFLLTLSFAGIAQSPALITLEQAIERGMLASKSLRVSQGKYDYAMAKYEQTYDQQYPSLRLSAGYYRLSDVPEFQLQFPGEAEPRTLFPVYLNSFQNRLSLNEVIFAGFRVKTLRRQQAKISGLLNSTLKKISMR